MELQDRKMKILQAIIRNYLETGEPVGSRTAETQENSPNAEILNLCGRPLSLCSKGGSSLDASFNKHFRIS